MKNQRPIEKAANADLRGSLPALRRAAVRAREIAAETGTAIVVVHEGSVQHRYPQRPKSKAYVVNDAATTLGKPA